MNLIGRKPEQQLLSDCLESNRPEFLVLYGRRRIGKTYLIREYFNNAFSFYATGVAGGKTQEQLRAFSSALKAYGDTTKGNPSDWFEAFFRLQTILEREDILRDPVTGKLVIFLDEVPWMDTARSNFKSALDYFWNSWASAREDILLIVCGSATSWIIDNLLNDNGGFYNRVTHQIHLQPFTLKECEELLNYNGIAMTRHQIIECYMTFGGVPYYMNCLNRRLSLPQNIDALCFNPNGPLHFEFDRLFASLFRNPARYIAIIREASRKRIGITRVELSQNPEIGDGEPLTRVLSELEQCGFIRKYRNYLTPKQGHIFQIIDPFVLFYLNIMEHEKVTSWSAYVNTPGYNAWIGNSFELVCLNHLPQMKHALGISGIQSNAFSWRSKKTNPGAQIDLLIDRSDGIINICEMKYSKNEYEITASYEKQLIQKLQAFQEEVAPKKALHLTMVSASGLKRNKYFGSIQSSITGDDLFAL